FFFVALSLPFLAAATTDASRVLAPTTQPPSRTSVALPLVDVGDYVNKVVRPHRGRGLVVNFWARWWASCLGELPALARAQEAFPAGAVDIVLVSADEGPSAAQDAKSALEKLDVSLDTFLYAGDDPLALCRVVDDAWRGELPYTVVYDAEGRATAKLLGEQDEATFRRVITAALAVGGAPKSATARR
ncbi:MAG: TlpA family protein disulfide reductase, partial [Myxococcota bacterium]